MLHISSHLVVLQLGDPAVVPELHCDDSNTTQLMDVVKLLVPSPAFRYEPLSA